MIEEFERGDVVWDIDPFKQDPAFNGERKTVVAPRPWLVVSDGSVPFHPEQYLCVTLTTRTWHDDSIPVVDSHWRDGGAPGSISIMPWSVSAIQHDYLDTTGELVARLAAVSKPESPASGYQGCLDPVVVDDAARQLVGYLEAPIES